MYLLLIVFIKDLNLDRRRVTGGMTGGVKHPQRRAATAHVLLELFI